MSVSAERRDRAAPTGVPAVPYFSQWASRDLTAAFLADGTGALAQDPCWEGSGARTREEYVAWASNVCGMACLKMVLAARTGRIVPTLDLARACTAYGGYVVDPDTAAIRGLIYAPFVQFVEAEFAIGAEVVTHVASADLPRIMARAEFFLASVHSSIRYPDQDPPVRGGHLVLVIAASNERVIFHNPSGHDALSQAYAELALDRFGKFFAGRGIGILK